MNLGEASASNPINNTSSSLLRLVKQNDDEAWERLLDLYGPLVYSWCRHCGMQADDAADVLQEVFRAVAGGIANFRYDRPGDTFRGWLRTITHNKIRDHYRRSDRQPQADGGTASLARFSQIADDDSSDQLAAEPMGGLLRRALDLVRVEFTENTWQAFWLTTVEQQPTIDVAEQLGITSGAVRQAKYKVLRRLREELGEVE